MQRGISGVQQVGDTHGRLALIVAVPTTGQGPMSRGNGGEPGQGLQIGPVRAEAASAAGGLADPGEVHVEAGDDFFQAP